MIETYNESGVCTVVDAGGMRQDGPLTCISRSFW